MGQRWPLGWFTERLQAWGLCVCTANTGAERSLPLTALPASAASIYGAMGTIRGDRSSFFSLHVYAALKSRGQQPTDVKMAVLTWLLGCFCLGQPLPCQRHFACDSELSSRAVPPPHRRRAHTGFMAQGHMGLRGHTALRLLVLPLKAGQAGPSLHPHACHAVAPALLGLAAGGRQLPRRPQMWRAWPVPSDSLPTFWPRRLM